MKIYEARAELAVANALRHLDSTSGPLVNVTRIEKLWQEYGIRDSDLPAAIEQMVRADRLMQVRDGRHHAVALTPAGEAWFRSQSAWLEYSLLVPRRERSAFRRCSVHRRSANDECRHGDQPRKATRSA